jgi:hypothetical protein
VAGSAGVSAIKLSGEYSGLSLARIKRGDKCHGRGGDRIS